MKFLVTIKEHVSFYSCIYFIQVLHICCTQLQANLNITYRDTVLRE